MTDKTIVNIVAKVPLEYQRREYVTLNGGEIYRRTTCLKGEHSWFEFLPLSRCDCGMWNFEEVEGVEER